MAVYLKKNCLFWADIALTIREEYTTPLLSLAKITSGLTSSSVYYWTVILFYVRNKKCLSDLQVLSRY